MTSHLTTQQLNEIQTRTDAATPGPWTVELEQCDCSDGLCSHGTYVSAVYADGDRRTEFSDFPDADWQFAIHARTDVPALLEEIRRLDAELDRAREDLAFMGRTTLPELRRTVEHHQAGKQRWRARAEKAEARVRELERPAAEAKRNEIRQSFTEIAAQCEQDRDYEAAANFQLRLREREEQWAAEDAAARP